MLVITSMAAGEYLPILLQSVASGNCRAWNDWRIEHPNSIPRLFGVDLWHSNLPFINFKKSDLRLANLSEVNFYRANLENSDLSMAILKDANLGKANLKGASLYKANLQGADLRHANLRGADLRGADLAGALLKNADLTNASTDAADLKQLDDLCTGGVSRLERIALRLLKYSKGKRIFPPVLQARKAKQI